MKRSATRWLARIWRDVGLGWAFLMRPESRYVSDVLCSCGCGNYWVLIDGRWYVARPRSQALLRRIVNA